ncbi:disease resistance protein RPV1 [Trifolium repens]|nr:disease resistance protein RPV1 [Trifolium repens]
MSEMRFLKFYYGKCNGTSNIYLPENSLDSLSDKLRYLEWHRYCLKSLPSQFSANFLVELSMPYSNLQKLWDGVKNLANLKEIDLRFNNELVEVPDLSKATNLEWLALTGCRNLHEIHPSIWSLNKLKDLELEGTSIQELPSSIWCCQKLKMIDLHNCDNLVGFGQNENFIEIGSLSSLVLSGCKKLNASNLCFNFKAWQSTLTSLNLENSCNLEALPDSIGLLSSLQCLKLSGSNVERLSPNIKNLHNLNEPRLDNCKKLVSVSVSELPQSLRLFSAINCISLVSDLTTLDIPFEHRTKPQPYIYIGFWLSIYCVFLVVISAEGSGSKLGKVVAFVVIAVVVGAGLAGYVFYKYRLRSYMDSEIMAIMSQYMPLDQQNNVVHAEFQPFRQEGTV